MSVHFRGKCHVVDNIIYMVPCNTKWNKTQPNIVMQGFTRNVDVLSGTAYIHDKIK